MIFYVNDRGPNWSLDIWYYGCLIFEIYNGNFNAIEEIKTKGNIPSNLFTVYKDVMKGDPKARASPSSVLQKLSVKGELFNNEFIQASNFLENFALKETYEKDQFFRFFPLSFFLFLFLFNFFFLWFNFKFKIGKLVKLLTHFQIIFVNIKSFQNLLKLLNLEMVSIYLILFLFSILDFFFAFN